MNFRQHTLSAIAKFCLAGTFVFTKIFYLAESSQFAFIGNGRLARGRYGKFHKRGGKSTMTEENLQSKANNYVNAVSSFLSKYF